LDVAPFSGERVIEYEGFKKYLSTGGLNDGVCNFEEFIYSERPSRADIIVKKDDIIYARMLNTSKVKRIDSMHSEIIVSTGFAVHRPDCKVLSGEYLEQFFKTKYFLRQKDKFCTGAIQPAITNEGIKNIRIPLPPLQEQIRIADILSRTESLIAKRKESIRLLDDLVKSMFLDMFSTDKSIDWETTPIENLALDEKGSMRTGPFGSDLLHDEFTDEGDVKVLGIDNVVNNRFEQGEPRFITFEKYEKLKRYRVYPGDVLITIMGTNGRSVVVPSYIPLSINTKHIAAITLKQNVANPTFLSYSIVNDPSVLKQIALRTRGAIMNGLNLTIIKSLQIKLPPVELQNKFASVVEKVEATKVKYRESLSELEALYCSLSQRAFRGELNYNISNVVNN